HKDYHKVGCIPSDSTKSSLKEHLINYLDSSLEYRRDSPPFFLYPSPPDLVPGEPGTDSLIKLINKMLQSGIETWPRHIHKILKTKPSDTIKNFWEFMYEILPFMTTPVLQKILFELSKEEEDIQGLDWWQRYQVQGVQPEVIIRFENEMKKHISLLEREDKPKEVVNIFTRNEQEKLGEYGIQLEKQWSGNDEVVLYKNWASHMRVYMNVQGAVKGALECQAIQVSWIKLETFHSLGFVPVVHEMREALNSRLSSQSQAITNELIASIQLLDEELWSQFWSHQKEFNYGINSTSPWSRKSLAFWVKFMPLYLKIRMRKDAWKWQHLIELCIVDVEPTKAHHLESIMIKYLDNPLNSNTRKDSIVGFLEKVLETSEPGRVTQIVTERLKMIKNEG
ncbi:hypothetical protein DFH28DRAFT_882618, partial [Melampsora americana]